MGPFRRVSRPRPVPWHLPPLHQLFKEAEASGTHFVDAPLARSEEDVEGDAEATTPMSESSVDHETCISYHVFPPEYSDVTSDGAAQFPRACVASNGLAR